MGYWMTYQRVAPSLPVRGNLVPVAQLVAPMKQHGVTTIRSRDADLRKFTGVTVRDPFRA